MRSILIFCAMGIFTACASQCVNYTDIVHEDVFMRHETFQKVKTHSVYDCAAHCLMSSACLSFNFDFKGRTCDLNSENSDKADVTSRPGFMFSDIKNWPKDILGPCSTIACPKTTACSFDRRGVATCSRDCGSPPLPIGSTVKYDGHLLDAVASYSCDEDFKTCLSTRTSVCRSSGQWDDLNGLCAQNRWTNPTMPFIGRLPCGPGPEMALMLTGTPTGETFVVDLTNGRDVLLHTVSVGSRICFNACIGLNLGFLSGLNSPLVINQRFQMNITLSNGEYVIVVDGSLVKRIRGQQPGHWPTQIEIYKNVVVHEVIIS